MANRICVNFAILSPGCVSAIGLVIVSGVLFMAGSGAKQANILTYENGGVKYE